MSSCLHYFHGKLCIECAFFLCLLSDLFLIIEFEKFKSDVLAYFFFFLCLGFIEFLGSVGFYSICQVWELLDCYFFRIFSVFSSLLLHGFQLHLLIYWPFEVVSHLTDDYLFFLLFLSASFHIVSITITLVH